MVDITEGGPVADDEASAAVAAAKATAKAAAKAAAAVINQVDRSSLLHVLLMALLSAVLCEAISWWFVYSRNDYERLNNTFKKASKRLEKKKEEALAPAQPSLSGKGGTCWSNLSPVMPPDVPWRSPSLDEERS